VRVYDAPPCTTAKLLQEKYYGEYKLIFNPFYDVIPNLIPSLLTVYLIIVLLDKENSIFV
jgi:hypothetical protein